MKYAFQIGVAFVIAGVAFVAGYIMGMNKGSFNAGLEENKVAAACLGADDLTLSAEFREYLKGRIYYNIASKYPNDAGYLLRKDWDFGPVDVGLLKRRIYAKDPTFECDSFDSATRHLADAERADAPSQQAQPDGGANRPQGNRATTNSTPAATGSHR